MVVVFIRGCSNGEYKFSDFLDVSILVSFILLFICEVLANILSAWIMGKCEDAAKLTENYTELVNMYCKEKLISYKGKKFLGSCIALRRIEGDPFDFKFKFDTKNPVYQLPEQIAEHSEELMKAHARSKVYNSMGVRLNECTQKDNKVKLVYSKTMYFDSLITNRVMDYPMAGKNIREIYEPGPFLSTLLESKLSNHLGFNGFVELADEKIIFVHRNDKVSIGKGMLSTSVSASYKAKYGLNKKRHMTNDTLGDAIRYEIYDELGIAISEEYKLENNIFSFYRDLVEGGKPQFLFYVKIQDISSMEFENVFRKKIEREKRLGCCREDLKNVHFEYFSLEELRLFKYKLNGFLTSDNQTFTMMPSSVVSVILLLQMT